MQSLKQYQNLEMHFYLTILECKSEDMMAVDFYEEYFYLTILECK